MSDEEDICDIIDENSLSNSFNTLKLQDYKSFQRPEIKLDPSQDVYIMNLDITSTVKNIQVEKKTIGKPFIKIFGVNSEGNSFEVMVSEFVPYFYAMVPEQILSENEGYSKEDWNKEDFNNLRAAINAHYVQLQVSKHKKQYYEKNAINQEPIVKIETAWRTNIKGYIPDQHQFTWPYLKICVSSPNVVAAIRGIFEKQARLGGVVLAPQTFQSNIPYALRFMVDKDIVGMGWLKIKGGQYTIRTQIQKDSVCQVQLQCKEQAVEMIECAGQWSKIAPLRVLSFDIECAAQQGFPSADQHPVIQIACCCKTTTQKQQDYKVVFALNGCSKISGVNIKESNDQRQILEEFQNLILSYDPDFIIGYNIINFDLCYLLDRAAKLKIKQYGHFGRNLYTISRIKKGNLQSKQLGNRDTKEINIQGRIQLDLMIHMHRQHKLSSYSLNNVSYHFLKEQKQDVHHSQIYKLFLESKETRKRLAIYCLKDAQLPLKLMEKLCCLYNYSEMARVTGVPMSYLLTRGQQIKVMSQLMRKAKTLGYILPTTKVTKNADGKGFDGAYVLDPVTGFYTQPIATLDFASLYPSIMMAHNLCYTTLIDGSTMDRLIENGNLTKNDVTQTPEKYYFVKSTKRQGLLPLILKELIATRKKAKQELAKTEDEMMRNVLEGRQLALKISANSVYGFTGALVGQLPCLQISSSVTAFGRKMIDKTRMQVQRLYPGAQVIYGDTDSVMVKFKLHQSQHLDRTSQIIQAMKYGKAAAVQISKQFEDPIKLQFQKVYCPYLLMAKKRYVGVYYSSNPAKHDKIDKKGLQSVRRDNCYLIRQMLQTILEMLLCHNDKDGIVDYVKKMVSDLVQNKIDISKLVITKAISKNTEDDDEDDKKDDGKDTGKSGKNTYKVKQAHVELAEKMKKRDQNITVGIGDRISYVMIAGQKGSKNYENAQDPIKVLEDDLPIDYDYYINKQLKPPLQRLLKNTGIISNLDILFSGQHTKNWYIPKLNKSNMMSKFIKVHSTCINCPSRSEKPLCERCEPKALQVYINKQLQFESLQCQFTEMWRECQSCQGSINMEVLCSNFDCPIFYKRIKVKNDLNLKREQMEKLDLWTQIEF